MEDLKAVTWRSNRTILERLSGWPAAYRCRVTDGYRYADSRGPSAEAAEEIARENWRKEHGSKRRH